MIEPTIKSILNQSFTDYEYIIIDGESTDGTLQIIDKYRDKVSEVISEPDDGIYDAMNKGLHLAKGHFVNFLNAGDVYSQKDSLENILDNSQYYDLIYSNINVLDNNGKFLNYQKSKELTKEMLLRHSTAVLCHQAIFVRKEYAPKYETKYTLKGELNWYFDILKRNPRIKQKDFAAIDYRLGGYGSTVLWPKLSQWISINYRNGGVFGVLKPMPYIFREILRYYGLIDYYYNFGYYFGRLRKKLIREK